MVPMDGAYFCSPSCCCFDRWSIEPSPPPLPSPPLTSIKRGCYFERHGQNLRCELKAGEGPFNYSCTKADEGDLSRLCCNMSTGPGPCSLCHLGSDAVRP
ncbi:hypothetical protein MPTK1_2g11090 [Marchantia polymorpha subsp. ruderalis]|uniref:Uncharacterized protein n=1 Tax=Marchantia polymorpha TaxID=3197 RepID=A0A2R6XCB4_MARPO|nr:hypothetical protein MARPO_0023s0076 [Marchantia polymorpha]BBN01890.1 hypothetical protein Mp_2g11090 [Marchantia polymorpha subsp. ruderalis]|eukprot:PTQ43754.1 hypothetical protein MARPO_0023s0076 [Marchantia polymorpha]